jgi:hypothetical protein
MRARRRQTGRWLYGAIGVAGGDRRGTVVEARLGACAAVVAVFGLLALGAASAPVKNTAGKRWGSVVVGIYFVQRCGTSGADVARSAA